MPAEAIRRIASGGLYEEKVGYCRAVVADGLIHVAGTTAQGREIPEDVAEQCASALSTIRAALEEAGASMADVLRVRYILPDRHDFAPCWPLLQAAFGAAPPAATMIEAGLVDPRYKIEIEVTARAPRH